jgi:hypothetical protein
MSTGFHSKPFGQAQFGQMPAWATAANGGLIENDYGRYYQIPVQRRQVPFPTRYRFVVARGARREVMRRMRTDMRDARLIMSSDDWFLFERSPLETNGLSVVRSAQGWDELRIDRSVTGSPLSVAKETAEHGFGTHAASFLRVLVTRPGSVLTGACGVDDAAPSEALLSFRIRSNGGAILFESGQMQAGEAARHFSVPIPASRQLLLEVSSEGPIEGDHADWLNPSIGTGVDLIEAVR